MILTAKTEGAYHAAARLPTSLPLENMRVDVDPLAIELLDREDYIETSFDAAKVAEAYGTVRKSQSSPFVGQIFRR